jgi:transcriptional regulator with XRE-family HTH domain
MTFADAVKKKLIELGWSISELSFNSRVREDTIRKILTNNSDPRLSTAKKIADALGVSLDSLVREKDYLIQHLK